MPPPPQMSFDVFRLTHNTADGTFTVGGKFYHKYVVYDNIVDGAGDNNAQLGDVSGDHFTQHSEIDPTTFTGTYVGSVNNGGGFVGGNFGSYFLYTDNSYSSGQVISADRNQAFAVCYAAGTLIRTERGDVAVESLTVGDLVVTASGAHRTIKWLGQRSYAGRFANSNPDTLPICFKAGSLADNVPARDLWVSPKHAMFLDGVLIPAEQLVNGVTITKAERIESVTYHHVELDSHDVLLAEGAPSESYVDDDNRNWFHNVAEFALAYPDNVPTEAVYCAPRVEDGHLLAAVRRRLDERAGLFADTARAAASK